jgi:hypothetical protein
VIDVTEFDRKNPVFVRAIKMDTFRDTSNKVIQTLERGGDSKEKLNPFDTTDALNKLLELTRDDGKVCASALEGMLSAYMSDGSADDLHTMSRGLIDVKHDSREGVIQNRSLSVAFIHSKGAQYFYTPSAFLTKKRENCNWDVLLAPQKVIEAERNKKKEIC